MTYPPQGPPPQGPPPQGPGPYGPDPGQQGQPQQGGFPPGAQPPPQQGGYGQQPPPGYGQQPQTPGYGQSPPPGQPPPPGADSPFGPPPGQFGDPGDGPGGEPPKKNKTGLFVGIGSAAVVVIAALLVTGLAWPGWMTGGNEQPTDTAGAAHQAPPPASSTAPSRGNAPGGGMPTAPSTGGSGDTGEASAAKAVAQQAADAVNSRDADAIADVSCESPSKKQRQSASGKLDKLDKHQVHWTLKGSPKVTGNKAKVQFNVSAVQDGKTQSGDVTASMKKVGGSWCMSG